jgi:hypothetical protein
VRRRALLLLLFVLVAARPVLASASTLGGLTVQSLTTYAAASTVPTSSCNSNPTQDATIDGQRKNSNYGSQTTLTVTSNGTKPAYGLVQFTPCASANAYIVSATLALLLSTAPGGTRTYGAFPVSGGWVESTVTWNTAPGISGTASATQTTGASGSTMQWTVTGDVQGFVNGGANNGWALEDTGTTYDSGSLDSREGATQPVLSIVYYP